MDADRVGNEDGAINICYIQKRLRKIRYNKSYMRDRRWKRREEKRSKGTQKEEHLSTREEEKESKSRILCDPKKLIVSKSLLESKYP